MKVFIFFCSGLDLTSSRDEERHLIQRGFLPRISATAISQRSDSSSPVRDEAKSFCRRSSSPEMPHFQGYGELARRIQSLNQNRAEIPTSTSVEVPNVHTFRPIASPSDAFSEEDDGIQRSTKQAANFWGSVTLVSDRKGKDARDMEDKSESDSIEFADGNSSMHLKLECIILYYCLMLSILI